MRDAERCGPWQTCFDRWRRDGTRDRLLAHAQTRNDTIGEVERGVSVEDGALGPEGVPGVRGGALASTEELTAGATCSRGE